MPVSPDVAGYVTDIPYVAGFKPMLAPAWLDFVALIGGVRPPARTGGFTWCDLGCGQGVTAAILAATHPDGVFHGIEAEQSAAACSPPALRWPGPPPRSPIARRPLPGSSITPTRRHGRSSARLLLARTASARFRPVPPRHKICWRMPWRYMPPATCGQSRPDEFRSRRSTARCA